MSKITDATEALRWVVSDECEADDTITILATEVSALQARLAAAEARAERAVGVLRDARYVVSAHPMRTESGGWMAQPVLARIDALLKEVAGD